MFGFGNGSYYDNLRDIYGEEEAFARYQKKCGKLLVATANNNGDTRLFVRSVNPLTDMRKKNGWWNTFTITNKPYDAGTFICKVGDVRADKNGYPIFVAHPVKRIDETIMSCDELMYLFGISNMFIEDAAGWNGEYNYAYFERQIEEIGSPDYCDDVNRHVSAAQEAVRLFVNGKICRDQIVAWLREPTEWQKAAAAFEEDVCEFFNNDLETMAASASAPDLFGHTQFPLLAEKFIKFRGDRRFVSPEQKVVFVKDLLAKYEYTVNAGHIQSVDDQDMWHKIESYLEFDEARKKAQKAAKTAAKKAKKAAVKADK